jgi:hypothetical protein
MPGDSESGASVGGGFDMFLQLEGDVVEAALFRQSAQGLPRLLIIIPVLGLKPGVFLSEIVVLNYHFSESCATIQF